MRSLSEQNGMIVALLAIGVVLCFAAFVMVLVSFLNSRRERENSDRLLVNEAKKVVAEREKVVVAETRAEEAERLHCADLALIKSQMAEDLAALRVATQRAAALLHQPVNHVDARVIRTGRPDQPLMLPANGRLTAVEQGTPRAMLSAVPTERPMRPSQIVAALETSPVAAEAVETALSTDVPEYVYTPTEVFAGTPEKALEEAPDPVNAAWFEDPDEPRNGDLYVSPEGNDELSAPPMDVEAQVSGGAKHEPAGTNDEGALGAAARDELTSRNIPEEPTSSAVSTEGSVAEDDTPALGLELPNRGEAAIDPEAMVNDLKALRRDLDGTLGTLRNIPRMAGWSPQTATNMNPVSGPDGQTNAE